jgi:CHASE3 domain sensor protein
MGKGFTPHNVWPQNSTPNRVTVPKKSDSEVEVVSNDEDKRRIDDFSTALAPLLEAINKLVSRNEKETEVSPIVNDSIEKKLELAKRNEKFLLIVLIILGILAFISFLSAVWSANSVEKLLRIIYKLKQSKI